MKFAQRPRTAARLTASVQKSLNLYALAAGAAGVGVLALAQPAHARIVYTRAHQKLPVNQDFFLDLNHEGTNDFVFRIATFTLRGTFTNGPYAELTVANAPQTHSSGNGIVRNGSCAAALSAGARIGPQAQLTNGAPMGIVQVISGKAAYHCPWADSGKSVDNRYLGVKFTIKGRFHYGWARFNVRIYSNPAPTAKAVLTGYAYETIPNKPIIAGKTHGSDAIVEPGTLGHLARGASAIPGWRVKQTAATTH